jgi:zinc-ribbon domain
MSAQFCSKCGAALPPGSQFCAYCGSPAPNMGAAPPLASAGPTPPPYPPYPTMEPSGRPSGARRRRGFVIAVVVVLIVAIIGAVAFYELTAPNVNIEAFIIYAPDNVCGLNEPNNMQSYFGFNDTPGDTDFIQFPVPNFNTTSCSVVSVATNTSGFSIVNFTGTGPIAAQETGTLNLNLTLPNSSWTGNVNLIWG